MQNTSMAPHRHFRNCEYCNARNAGECGQPSVTSRVDPDCGIDTGAPLSRKQPPCPCQSRVGKPDLLPRSETPSKLPPPAPANCAKPRERCRGCFSLPGLST